MNAPLHVECALPAQKFAALFPSRYGILTFSMVSDPQVLTDAAKFYLKKQNRSTAISESELVKVGATSDGIGC